MEEDKLNALFAGVQYDIQQIKLTEKGMALVGQEMQSHLIDKFEARVAKHPKKPFIIFDGLVYTYEAIDTLACKVAVVARTWDLQPYDCVAIMMQNEPAFVYTFLGLQKLGIPVAFINTNLTGQLLVYSLKSVECKVLLVGSDNNLLKAVKDVMPQLDKLQVYGLGMRQSDLPYGIKSLDNLMRDSLAGAPSPFLRSGVTLGHTCSFIFTSGTTGKPKPVFISQAKAVSLMCVMPSLLDDTQDDIVYITVPLYHTTGFYLGFGGALLSGCTVVLRKRFSARHFWSDCRQYKVTIIPYVGELLRYLLSPPKSELDGVHNVRAIFGNGLRADIWQEVKERFKIPVIYEMYGSTEGLFASINLCGKPGTLGRLSPLLSRLDSKGKCLVKFDFATALPIRDANGRCIRVETGEPGLMLSKVPDQIANTKFYKAGQEETEKKMVRDVFAPGDCYLNYGDAFILDKDYFLYFYDRLGDTFRWKGENVSTKDVANVVSSLPFVEDANVYGVTLPGHEGKAGMAAINLNPKAQLGNIELHELYTHVCKELPSYARPLFLRHIPEAALTGTFKNTKVDLAKEGYDLEKVRDPLYFIDHENHTYSSLNRSNLPKLIKSRL